MWLGGGDGIYEEDEISFHGNNGAFMFHSTFQCLVDIDKASKIKIKIKGELLPVPAGAVSVSVFLYMRMMFCYCCWISLHFNNEGGIFGRFL